MSKNMATRTPLAWLPGDIYVNENDLDLDWRELRHIIAGSLLVIVFVVAVAFAASGS